MCKCVITVEEKVAVKYQPKPKALTSDHITGVNRPLKKTRVNKIASNRPIFCNK